MEFDLKKKAVPFAVFFAVANPATYKLTRSVLGSWVAAADGLPTTAGLLLHALVFVILAHFLWKLVWGKRSSVSAEYAGANVRDEPGTISERAGQRRHFDPESL